MDYRYSDRIPGYKMNFTKRHSFWKPTAAIILYVMIFATVSVSTSSDTLLPYVIFSTLSLVSSISGMLFYIKKKLSLLESTEFQNCLLSNAAKSIIDIMLIVNDTGAIVYIDANTKKFLNIEGEGHSIKDVFYTQYNKLEAAIKSKNIFRFVHADRTLLLTPLPRPNNYFLIGGASSSYMSDIYANLLEKNSIGVYTENSQGKILYMNKAILDLQGNLYDVPHVSSTGDVLNKALCPFISDIGTKHNMLLPMHFAALCVHPAAHLSIEGQILWCNNQLAELSQVDKQSLLHRNLLDLIEPKIELYNACDAEVKLNGTIYVRICTKIVCEKIIIVSFIELSKQKHLEEKLLHSQRVSSVGLFAGGIAHDFNNILTVVLGFCDSLLLQSSLNKESITYVQGVKENIDRAADLVAKILAFSSKQKMLPSVINIWNFFQSISGLLKRILGANVHLKLSCKSLNSFFVKIDKRQMEQVIINFAVNSQAAIGNKSGGMFSIHTQNISITNNKNNIPLGDYLSITIEDNGCGIPDDILNKIYDPFFSTKTASTGLGLATVKGIITQFGGYIYIDTKIGRGTKFDILLPRSFEAFTVTDANYDVIATETENGSQYNILLLEDEVLVKDLMCKALQGRGYNVITENTVAKSMDLAAKTTIDLIISDVIMPEISGPEAAGIVKQLYPKAKVMFISGYTKDKLLNNLDFQYELLSKPFAMNKLLQKISILLAV